MGKQHQRKVRSTKFRRRSDLPKSTSKNTNPRLRQRNFWQLVHSRKRPQSLSNFQKYLQKLVDRWFLQHQQQGKAREVFRYDSVSLTHWRESLSQWGPRLRGILPKLSVLVDISWALLPVFKEASLATAETVASRRMPFLGPSRRQELMDYSQMRRSNVSELMQSIYFQRTWLDSWTVSAVCKICAGAASLGHMVFYYDQVLRPWQAKVARRRYDSIPVSGYDTFMLGYLLIGQAMGYFRGGAGRLQLLQVDSLRLPAAEDWALGPVAAPRSVSQAIADIDQIYWAECPGFLLKIIRIEAGPDSSRVPRWIVVLPGTDHISPVTTTNPADFQSNIKEVLGYPSTVREGVRRAILEAMSECGISGDQIARQQVVIVGHSQGGLIGSNMAISPDIPFRIVGLVSAGAPIGRVPVRRDVVQVALRHDQDVVYSLDGCDGVLDPSIVLLTRSLEEPKRGPLYYAHSTGTYVDTARLMEFWAQSDPDSAVGKACHFINDFFPRPDEPTKVFYYQVTQEVLSVAPTPVLQVDQLRRATASTVAPVNIISEDDKLIPPPQNERVTEDER